MICGMLNLIRVILSNFYEELLKLLIKLKAQQLPLPPHHLLGGLWGQNNPAAAAAAAAAMEEMLRTKMKMQVGTDTFLGVRLSDGIPVSYVEIQSLLMSFPASSTIIKNTKL